MIIIPARGGSKRIPNKNIVDLNGKPLIAHTIETCLSVTPEVYVSTDSEEIASCAEFFGAKIIIRPKELATDMSSTNSVVNHFLEVVDTGEYFACVQATSPLLESDYLLEGFKKIKDLQYNSIIAVTEVVGFYWTKDGLPVNFSLEEKRKRTQDSDKWYMENGAFYLTSRESFQKSKNLISKNVGFVTIPKQMSFEIDDYQDLEIVKRMMKC